MGFQPKHNWAPKANPHPAAGVQSPTAPGQATTAAQPVQTVSEEAEVDTPADGADEQAGQDAAAGHPHERAGASADPKYKVGDTVRIKGKGKSNFTIDHHVAGDDGALIYHGTNAKGAKVHAHEHELDAVR